jgi:phosphoglycolate phosphatase
MQKLIIFDMDGTLIDSGNVIANTINHVRINSGLQAMPKEELLHNVNNPDINPSQFFYETDEFTPEHTKLFEEYYNEHCITDIELYEGIEELLEKLSKEFKLCVATNASTPFAKKMLEHVKIDHYFDKIVGADLVPNPKPHPDMLHLILDELKICHTQSLLIGDSPKDMLSAQQADMESILVCWGFTQYENGEAQTRMVCDSVDLYEKIKNR